MMLHLSFITIYWNIQGIECNRSHFSGDGSYSGHRIGLCPFVTASQVTFIVSSVDTVSAISLP
uniref:Uncharacterized protein n=1 Tax=Arundo donax TaxID=35708 RepID=A0A0A8YMX7_ARUDO